MSQKSIWQGVGLLLAAGAAWSAYLGYCAQQRDALAQRPGFTCRTFIDAKGEESKYIVFRPHSPPPPEGYPVILFLNGYFENGNDGLNQLSRNLGVAVWELKGGFPFIVVAPQCRTDGAWTELGRDVTRALGTLEEVLVANQGDRERVYLTGPSSGGRGVLAVASHHSELFAAIVPLCAGSSLLPPAEQVANSLAEGRLPVWCICNERDDFETVVPFSRRLRAGLLQAGVSPYFTEYDLAGHNCWDVAYRTPVVYDWMLRHSRSSNQRTPKFDSLADQVSMHVDELSRPEWSLDAEQVLRGAAAEGKSSTLLLSEPDGDRELELHGDVRFNADDRWCLDLIPTAGEAGSKLSLWIELPEQGSGALLSGSRECLATFDPIGQRNILPGRWNDFRLRLAAGELRFECNGWELLTVALGDEFARRYRIQLRVDQGDVEWRFLRSAQSLRGQP